jgi:methionyl-tRNA synthetase
MTEKPQGEDIATYAEAMELISDQAGELLDQLRPQMPITEQDKYEASAMQALRALKYYGEEIPYATRDLTKSPQGFLTPAAYFVYACAVMEAPKVPESATEACQMVKKFARRISF